MRVYRLGSFPPHSNPYHYEGFLMGRNVGNNVTVMMENFEEDRCRYLIIVDTESGERLRVIFDEELSPIKVNLISRIINFLLKFGK